MRHRIASATTSIAACSLFTFICSFGVAAYSADGPEGKASNGDASATSAADHKSGAKSTQIDRQLRKVGSWRNIDSIVRTWGSITGPKIYFSDAAHASSAQGLLADICPGDDRHVRFLVQIDVNNLEDDVDTIGSTEGQTCGYSNYFSGGSWNHSSPLFEIRGARIQLCKAKAGQISATWSCTAWTGWTDNPFS